MQGDPECLYEGSGMGGEPDISPESLRGWGPFKSAGYIEGKLGRYRHSHPRVRPWKNTAAWILSEVQPQFLCDHEAKSAWGLLRHGKATCSRARSSGRLGQGREPAGAQVRWGAATGPFWS